MPQRSATDALFAPALTSIATRANHAVAIAGRLIRFHLTRTSSHLPFFFWVINGSAPTWRAKVTRSSFSSGGMYPPTLQETNFTRGHNGEDWPRATKSIECEPALRVTK